MTGEPWFRAKRFGYGAGWPLNWKGWLHLFAFVAVVVTGGLLVQNDLPSDERLTAIAIGVVVFVVPMLWLAAVKTEGGWRWRS